MSHREVIIGATAQDQVNIAETLVVDGIWQDNAGQPLDLAGAVIAVFDAEPACIVEDMTIEITDAANGAFSLKLSDTQTAKLHSGRRNWFRLQLTMSPDWKDTSPKTWIEIT